MDRSATHAGWKSLAEQMKAFRVAAAAKAARDKEKQAAINAKKEADDRLAKSADRSPAAAAAGAMVQAAATKLELAFKAATEAETKTFIAWQDAHGEYVRRLNDFFRRNEADFYVQGPQYREDGSIERSSPTEIDVHFGDAQAGASIDRLLAMFGLDAILEESNELKYRSTMIRLLESAAGALDAYRDRLVGDSMTIAVAIDAWANTGGWGKLSPSAAKKPKPNLALVQLGVLARVARELAGYPTAYAPQLSFQADVLESALQHSGSAIVRLSVVARALRDEAIRNQVTKHLRPVAQSFQESASQPLSPLLAIWWLFVAGIAASAVVLVVANALASTFGPVFTLGFVATPAALAVGLWLLRNNAYAANWARDQKNILRKYLSESLRGNADGVDEEDILNALGRSFTFVKATTPDSGNTGPIGWLRNMFSRTRTSRVITPESHVQGDWDKVRDGQLDEALQSVHEAPIPFGVPPAKQSHRASLSLMATCFVLVAAVDSIQVALPMLSQSAVSAIERSRSVASADWSLAAVARPVIAALPLTAAQMLRHTPGRESCQVAEGNLVWQDDSRLFLADTKGNIVSVARNEVSEVRFGASRVEADRCQTQGDFYGKTQINVAVPEPKVVVYGGTDITIATTPVAVSVPDDPSKSVLQFYSTVFVGGAPVEIPLPDASEWSHVILPVFTDKVELRDSRLNPDTPEYADRVSKFALCSSRDLELREAETALRDRWCQGWEVSARVALDAGVKPIREALATLRRQGCSVRVDVEGFASDNDFDGASEERDKELNWLLAEGRRVAVLLALGFNAETGMFALDAVEQGDGHGTLDLQPSQTGVSFADLKWDARFSDFDDMRSELGRWLDLEIQQNDPRQDGFAEALKRSVVIAIAREDLAKCRIPNAPGTLTAAAG